MANKIHVFAKHTNLSSGFYEARLQSEKMRGDATILFYLHNLLCSQNYYIQILMLIFLGPICKELGKNNDKNNKVFYGRHGFN